MCGGRCCLSVFIYLLAWDLGGRTTPSPVCAPRSRSRWSPRAHPPGQADCRHAHPWIFRVCVYSTEVYIQNIQQCGMSWALLFVEQAEKDIERGRWRKGRGGGGYLTACVDTYIRRQPNKRHNTSSWTRCLLLILIQMHSERRKGGAGVGAATTAVIMGRGHRQRDREQKKRLRKKKPNVML